MKVQDLKGYETLQAKLSFVGITPGPTTWLAGGALVRAWLGEGQDEGDLDFWFYEFEDLDNARGCLEHRGATMVKKTEYAETWDVAGISVQLCRNTYESMQGVVDRFDLAFCRIAYDGCDLLCADDTASDLDHKSIRVLRIGTQTKTRLVKYMARGFSVDPAWLLGAITVPNDSPEDSAYTL